MYEIEQYKNFYITILTFLLTITYCTITTVLIYHIYSLLVSRDENIRASNTARYLPPPLRVNTGVVFFSTYF